LKISRIEITNFLRLRRLKIDLKDPVLHLFAGHNEAGKTSLQEALRYCLLGETERISQKRDYKMMVTDGAKEGSVKVVLDTGVYVRDVASAKGTADTLEAPVALEYLLDATRYPWIDAKKRRAFMFGLLGITVNRDVVKERMQDREIPDTVIDKIMPMLRSGFDAAHKEAKNQATEARGGWAAITGERYGSEKAKTWKPAYKEVEESEIDAAHDELVQAELKYDEAQQAFGAFKGSPLGTSFDCPACGARLLYTHDSVREVSDEDREDHPLKDEEKRTALREAVDVARLGIDAAQAGKALIERQIEWNEHSDKVMNKAAGYSHSVESWAKCAESLAPDGIPGEIVADRLKPLNNRLRDTAMKTGWPQTVVTPTMDILVENRSFGLQSESSQWRSQTAIAEAISEISGVGLLVLDRLDVLDLSNRAALLKWLMSNAKDHNNILLIGTLKEPPKLPASVKVHWLENGEEAAA
jgi:hypothetical protein